LPPSLRLYQCSEGIKELEMARKDSRFIIDLTDPSNYGKILAHASAALLERLEGLCRLLKVFEGLLRSLRNP